MRAMHILKLPDGSTVQSLGEKSDIFWRESGVAKGTDLTGLKGGHAKKVMALAQKMYPDQVKAREAL